MKLKVVKKQTNSKNCFVCGLDNESGVKAPFYILEDDSVATLFEFKSIHQSYPGRTHGGVISAMLDELVGRALWIKEPNTYAVTTTMTIKFRRPVPYGTRLKARGYIVKDGSRLYVGRGEIYDMDCNLLTEFNGTYMKLSSERASNSDTNVEEEMCYNIADDVVEFDFPEREKD